MSEKPGLLLAAKLHKEAHLFEKNRLESLTKDLDKRLCIDRMHWHKDMADLFFDRAGKME